MTPDDTELTEVPVIVGDELPAAIGPYRIVDRVGSGAFAQVYFARHRETQAPHAVKVLREDLDPGFSGQVRVRFLAEEKIARAIDHPAIINIRETSSPGDVPCFIAMDFVEGLPFCQYFAQERFRRASREALLHELARLGHQLADALTAAHARGIVHRDLKPDNVLVTGGRHGKRLADVRLLDFGIAKAPTRLFSVDSAQSFTRYWTELGTVMGTPPYMAPEQDGAAQTATGKADVYALGVMLFITAFQLDAERLEAGEERLGFPADLERLTLLGPKLPDGWGPLLQGMLQQSPDARPEMRDVALKLQRLARPDRDFAAAVEAWVRSEQLPKASKLVGFLNWAERADYLTDDEVRFLKRAPVAKLRAFKALTLTGVGAGVLGLCTAGLIGVLVWKNDEFQSFRAEARTREDLQARRYEILHAELSDRARDVPRVVSSAAAPEASGGEPRANAEFEMLKSALGAAHAEKRKLTQQMETCSEAGNDARSRARALGDELKQCDGQLQRCEVSDEDCHDNLATCQREVTSQAQLLAATSSRLELCNQSLRATAEAPEVGMIGPAPHE